MREAITVLGHEVRPLTLEQMEKLEALMLAPMDAADPSKRLTNVGLARAVLTIALARDHADVDVNEIECDLAEIGAAQAAVLQLGGFMQAGEAAAAAGSNAPTGPASEAG